MVTSEKAITMHGVQDENDQGQTYIKRLKEVGSHMVHTFGFGVRKRYVNKNKKSDSISSCKFVRCKERRWQTDKRDPFVSNHRVGIRTDCKTMISIVLKNEKWKICYSWIQRGS